MRTEFVYSIIALGAIPVTVNAAAIDVQAKEISKTAMPSADGKLDLGKVTLAPGSYTLKGSLLSKVYPVKVLINGKQVGDAINASLNATELSIPIDLTKATAETEVSIELESTDPTEPGADFTLGTPYVNLTFDFASIKSTLVANANALKTTNIPAYPYTSTDDETAVDNLVAKINAIAETYEAYVAQKLYQDASVPQGEIDALAATIADHQNTQAYNDVNALITAIKGKYNTAVADLKAALVKEAAYLLDAALADLNTNINEKITDATSASYASYTGKTAVTDKATNLGKIPTEKALNDIVNNWKGQGTTNQAAYDALLKKVTDQQAALDAAVPEESVASLFPKTDAQAAIDALNTKIENAKNSAAQLTLDVTKEEAAAQKAVGDYATKVGKANAEYKANEATVAAIKTLQDNLDAAKAAVNAMKSADGNYEAKNYYDAYVADIQKDINKFSTDAAAAYKADGTGTAQAYNAALNTAPTQAKIDVYGGTTEPAADGMPKQAVDKYNALQTAMASYQKDLDAARDQVKDLAVYTADDYDYKTKFDLIQKRINDIKKAIKAAQEKVGAAHWEAMIAIDSDAAISNDIATLLSSVQAKQNEYDAKSLADGMTTLEGKITAFQAKDASVLGADVAKFQAIETGISDAYDAVKTAKNAINANSETVRYTERVETVNTAWWGNPDLSADWNPRNGYTGTGASPAVTTDDGRTQQMVENYNSGSCTVIGEILSQTISNLENGTYSVVLCANAFHANNVDNANGITEDANDVAYVFANGIKKYIVAKNASSTTVNGEYTIDNVKVTDGTLKIGLGKDKKGTNWHNIQIKSLKANTASLIQGWGKKVDDLNKQQTALESLVEPIAAKVAANKDAKTTLATKITTLQGKITTFTETYNIGDDEKTTLGNRGKADGSLTKELNQISKDLTDLTTANNAFVPATVSDAPKTDKVSNTPSDWGGVACPGDNTFAETYGTADAVAKTGVIMQQTVKGLDNGIYTVELYANANFTPNRGFTSDLVDGAKDVAYVFANGVQEPIVAHIDGGMDGSYKIANVIVSDGTLTMGLAKAKAGTNWHTIKIKSLTYRENNQLATYNNTEKTGLNDKYTALSAQETKLENAAPGIKTAVENNAKSKTAAQTAMTNLGTYELDNLKNLKDVSNPEGNFDTTDSDGNKNNAKKADPSNWAVFRSGLANDKNYQAKKNAIDATIAAMTAAITDANAAETLPYPWTDEITVTTPDDPATQDVDESSKTTYKIADIKAAVDALKTEAGTESENYWAYRNTSKAYFNVNINSALYVPDADVATLPLGTPDDKGNLATLDKEFPQAETDLAAIEKTPGEGAEPYYTGLIKKYKEERRDIIIKMLASLNGRTAAADNNDRVTELKDLVNKVKAIKGDADANLKKYTEQKKAYQDTQTLWNSTYTEIAATDKSSKVQEWLNELDAIQVTLTDATEAVEANYPKGESVAKAQDFATIQAAINDVKARQSAAYSAQITADNQAAHESFMGYDKEDGTHVDGTIEQATKAYQTAVRARAQYSSTNEDIKKAVDAAAATLDKALFSAPTDIAALTEKENKAYAETQSPTVFNVSTYNADALTIEQKITNALDDFKTAVKTAINGVWSPKKGDKTTVDTYAYKLDQAETAIDGYSKDAKTDAFKNVKDLIAQGDAGVKSMTLSKVEDAINALDDSENGIDAMLAADKDAAAVKDITAASAAASAAYSDAKSYIDGKTIADDYNNVKQTQLDNLEAAKTAADNVLETYTEDKWEYATHDAIAPALTNVVKVATAAKKDVDTAVESDVKNTKAYNEMVEVIKPVEAKLAEAETVAAPYKYAASFDTDETTLANIKAAAGAYKSTGTAVSEANKTDIKNRVATLSTAIETTMTNAFDDEKTGLTADITELKNQFNAYVADNGLNETANGYLADINALEKRRSEAAIKDLAITKEKPEGDGIDFEDIKAATNDLIKVQNDIANKESELLAANSSTANAKVLADFNNQIGEMEQTASLEGKDAWVGQQKLNGKTLEEQITALKAQIADVKTAVNAEPNIAFYKDQYQKKIDAIKTALKPVADEIAAKDAQFKANAAAYERLTAEINELQKAIDDAKAKVGGYDYVGPDKLSDYTDLIEDKDEDGELVGGAQYNLNFVRNYVDKQNINKTVHQIPEATISQYKTDISNSVQNYLDNSANDEIQGQRDNLDVLLTAAIDVKNHEKVQKYSSALWKRLADEKSSIYNEIVDLAKDIYYSGTDEEGSFDVKTDYEADVYIGISKTDGWATYYYQWDEEKNMPKAKTITCNADFDGQMKTVNDIKAKIESLSTAVKNLQLLGDANVDGKVNVLDYQLVTNMILDPTLQPNPESEDQTQADLFANIDINQSTVIEVGDLTAIVNYILKGNWQGYAAARSFDRGDNENLSLNYSSVSSGVQRIAVNLENANDYTAFQMDVVLPDGMKIVGTSLSSRAGESHKLYSREQLDGSTRILVSSITGETFSGNEGAVLYIDVEGAKASSVEILNILFSDVNANTRAFKLGNNVTGIDAIGSTFDALKQKVYDLGGRVMNGVKKGINIIRNADGSTRKVAE